MTKCRRPQPRENLGPGLRVCIYARQSDSDGQGERSLSLDSQESALRERAAREGWTVVSVERDPDIRGWKDETARPGFARVLERAARREFDLLLIWDLSRLARKVEFQERWVRILRVDGINIEAQADPDASRSPFIRQIKGAVAEEQTRQIAAHVGRALRERTRRGLPHGRAPWGYLRISPKGPLAPDPQRAPIVLALYEARAAGRSVQQCCLLAVHLCDQAGIASSRWPWTTMRHLLEAPAYRGALTCGGFVVENAHEAIVPTALWHAAQQPPHQHRRRVDPSLSWLSGLLDHACGGTMGLNAPSPGHTDRPWFRCPNLGRLDAPRTCFDLPSQVDAARMESWTWTALTDGLTRLLDPEYVAAQASARLAALGPDAGRIRRAAERARQRAAERRERAIEAYLAGVIDEARRDAEIGRAAAEIADADAQLAAIPAGPSLAEAQTTHALLRGVTARLPLAVLPADRAALLASLGRAVLLPVPGRDPRRRNPGRIELRWRVELAPFFQH